MDKNKLKLGDRNNLPDFIIGGAMKSGTTTLHHILNTHRNVFIPDEEIFFFNIDDIEQNSEFFIELDNKWTFFDYNKNFEKYLDWYSSFFSESKEDEIIGEDSTTYLCSEKSPKRIYELIPDVKLIFLVRDPVNRAYSHYWHMVRTGRAVYNFEKTIQFSKHNIIKRGLYYKQINRYLKYFRRENLKIIIFENFINNMQEVINEVQEFLGVDKIIDINKIDAHRNIARVPRNYKLQFLFNRLFRSNSRKIYLRHLPLKKELFECIRENQNDRLYKFVHFLINHLPFRDKRRTIKALRKRDINLVTLIDLTLKKMNFSSEKSYPPMRKHTRKFLQKLYSNENNGLPELIGNESIYEYWPYMKE